CRVSFRSASRYTRLSAPSSAAQSLRRGFASTSWKRCADSGQRSPLLLLASSRGCAAPCHLERALLRESAASTEHRFDGAPLRGSAHGKYRSHRSAASTREHELVRAGGDRYHGRTKLARGSPVEAAFPSSACRMETSKRVLVVDDDEVVRVMLEELLSTAGFSVT